MDRIRNIKQRLIIFILVVMGTSAGFSIYGIASDEAKNLPRAGDIIPEFTIPVPPNQTYRSYLNLDKGERFTPAEMNVQMLIIEVLNLY